MNSNQKVCNSPMQGQRGEVLGNSEETLQVDWVVIPNILALSLCMILTFSHTKLLFAEKNNANLNMMRVIKKIVDRLDAIRSN